MKEKYMKAVALELSDIRNASNYSLIDVQNNTKINKDTISKYENNKTTYKLHIIYTLLEFYNIEPLIFFKRINDRMQNLY